MTFKSLLSDSGLDYLQLSRNLGVSPNIVRHWHEECPEYVLAYLRLFIENRDCRELRRQVEKFMGLNNG